MPITQKFRRISSALLGAALVLQGSLSFADDTEIFLSRGASGVKPNVLFLLDDSGSMNWCVERNWKDAWSGCPDGSKTSRAQMLKDTMTNLLTEMKDVNVGLMVLNAKGQTSMAVGDIKDVRDTAIEKIKKMPIGGGTPIALKMQHAARYLSGFPPGPWYIGHYSGDAIQSDKDISSPIQKSCQTTHLVLLTDGAADGGAEPWIKNMLKSRWNYSRNRWEDIKGWNDSTACANRVGPEKCVPELAAWLHSEDQSPLDGVQTVTTHTIGFALNAAESDGSRPKAKIEESERIKKFLKDIASSGGGGFYTADTAGELSGVLENIMQQAANVDNATFVNPSAATPSSSRIQEQIYYALFRPTSSERWPGNLKRYRVDAKLLSVGGQMQKKLTAFGANGQEALNADGTFKADAQSWWSEQADGAEVSAGGAAWKLPEPAARHLWVSQDNQVKPLNQASLPDALQGEITEDQWQDLLSFAQGYSVDKTVARRALGDPLHSQPVLFDYASMQAVVIGTNEGFVHLLDRTTGIEQWAFMPEELLKNIKTLYDNRALSPQTPRVYGMDNTVTVWVEDKNANSAADAGEAVYAYASMRRGGRGIYALNISNPQQPTLAWSIQGGKDTGFERLGQTWSQPLKSQIVIGGQQTDVLIFGGGYDATEDDLNGAGDGYRTNAALGNDLYIVDAKSGKKLWSASSSDLGLDKMTYSIPSNVTLVSNSKGQAEQIFVGDTGGQIWRFIIKNGKTGKALVEKGAVDGVFARLGANNPQNARRFYHAPEVSTAAAGQLIVNIGSGYRAHPLDTRTNDRFYSLHTSLQSNEQVPTLSEASLADVTLQVKAEEADVSIQGKQGWYVRLTKKGEKVLSSPLSVNGSVYFNSYVPSVQTISCQVSQGANESFAVLSKNGAPAAGELRSFVSNSSGILGTPALIRTALGVFAMPGGWFSSPSPEECPQGKKCLPPPQGMGFETSSCANPQGCKTFWMDLSD